MSRENTSHAWPMAQFETLVFWPQLRQHLRFFLIFQTHLGIALHVGEALVSHVCNSRFFFSSETPKGNEFLRTAKFKLVLQQQHNMRRFWRNMRYVVYHFFLIIFPHMCKL